MRELVDEAGVRRFMRALGDAAGREGTCYLVGGATAVLLGWRATTRAADINLAPEQDEILRALPSIKHELALNVELASPAEFIPLPSGWEEKPERRARGQLSFRHFDLDSQALAKIERGHARDVVDVREMLARGLVEPEALRARFGRDRAGALPLPRDRPGVVPAEPRGRAGLTRGQRRSQFLHNGKPAKSSSCKRDGHAELARRTT